MAILSAIIGAAIPAAASLFSASRTASAAKRAGAVSAAGAERARTDLQPFRETGVNALGRVAELLGLGGDPGNALAALEASPGFQFRLGQGVDALDRSAAARGGLFSGNQGRAVTEFGQNFASNEFGNLLDRLGLLARGGQSAAAGQGAAGIQGANALAGGITGAGNAFARGATGVSNAITGGIRNVLFDRRTEELNRLFRPAGNLAFDSTDFR